jgi:hydroxyethylthiazole kinase-like sugar kinase family protein
MANVTTDLKGNTLSTVFTGYRFPHIGGPQILDITVDSRLTSGIDATDTTMDVAVIPKNSMVMGAHVILDTAQGDVVEGGTSTVNIGDGSTATLFGSAINLNAAVNSYVDGSDTFYSAATVVKITRASGTMNNARFRIRLLIINFGA